MIRSRLAAALLILMALQHHAHAQGDVSQIQDVPQRLYQVMTSPQLGMTADQALAAYRSAVAQVQSMRWAGPLWNTLSLQVSGTSGLGNWVDAAIRSSTPDMEARGASLLSLFSAQLRLLYTQGLRGAQLAEAFGNAGIWTIRNMNIALQAWRAALAGAAGAGAGGAGGAAGAGGFVAAEVLLAVVATAVTAQVSYRVGEHIGQRLARERDETAVLERRADDAERYATTLQLILERVRSSQVRPIRNLTLTQMVNQVQINLGLGNPPFQGVFEPRPCPDVSGAWEGELTIRHLSRPVPNLEEGRSRPVRGPAFTLVQEPNSCDVTLQFNTSTVAGYFEGYEQRQTQRGSQEIHYILLASNPQGNVTNVHIEYYGRETESPLPSSPFAGQINVVMEQQYNGATIESAGILHHAH